MARLDDKVALITGGETGIGLATARLFVAEGARVHLVAIYEAKLEAAVEELGDDNATSAVADVTDEGAVERAIAAGAQRHGRLDVLFSNAGIGGAVAPVRSGGTPRRRRSPTPCSTSPRTRARWSRRTRSRSTAE
jgi:NAD(P)-dependent dehydrogenase (short-subunit alcohol dehydrogenase family)